jgi:hypothetical protein
MDVPAKSGLVRIGWVTPGHETVVGAIQAAALDLFESLAGPITDGEAGALKFATSSLARGLIEKLTSRSDLPLVIVGKSGKGAMGSTELMGYADDEWQSLSEEPEARAWLHDKKGPLHIRIELQCGRPSAQEGFLMEVLAHELCGHAERMFDFVQQASEDSTAGVWTTEAQDHDHLERGNPRYMLIAYRYFQLRKDVKGGEQWNKFMNRQMMDTRMVKTPALPPGVSRV